MFASFAVACARAASPHAGGHVLIVAASAYPFPASFTVPSCVCVAIIYNTSLSLPIPLIPPIFSLADSRAGRAALFACLVMMVYSLPLLAL